MDQIPGQIIQKLLLVFALVTGSCTGGGGGSRPPATPPQPDLPPDGSRVCSPGEVCGCSHKPPGQDWQRLPDCTPEQPPEPPQPPEQPPTTLCAVTLDPAMLPPLDDDVSWDLVVGAAATRGEAVRAAIKEAQAACPSAWTAVGDLGACLTAGARGIDAAFAQVASRVHARGIKAGQPYVKNEPGKRVDALAVAASNDANVWEEWHLFEYDKGCLTGFPYKNSFRYRGAGTVPPDNPPSAGLCTAPLPPRFWTRDTLPDGWGEDEIGKPRWQLNCQRHGRLVDCTPVVAPRACAYCDSIGMGTYADGQLRCGCPVRNEGAPDREPCETYLIGATVLQSADGGVCERGGTNPLQFVPRDGHCRLCDETQEVCGAWF